MRNTNELVAAVEEKIDHGWGRVVPRDTMIYTLSVTPQEMQAITEVRMSARSGPRESWNREMANGLAERFGKIPTVQIQVEFAAPPDTSQEDTE